MGVRWEEMMLRLSDLTRYGKYSWEGQTTVHKTISNETMNQSAQIYQFCSHGQIWHVSFGYWRFSEPKLWQWDHNCYNCVDPPDDPGPAQVRSQNSMKWTMFKDQAEKNHSLAAGTGGWNQTKEDHAVEHWRKAWLDVCTGFQSSPLGLRWELWSTALLVCGVP